MKKRLSGRTALISGANRGLGLAIAEEFVRQGANLLICARDTAKLEEAKESLDLFCSENQTVLACTADISSEQEVRSLVRRGLDVFKRIDILVNNAGVYGPLGSIETIKWEEWVAALHINLMGSALMCRALLPHFKSNRYGKIIQLSGGGATNPLPRISAYAASKAAVVRLAETLAEEVRGAGIDVNAIAPGALNTRLLDQVLEAGPERVGEDFYARALQQKDQGGASLQTAADLAVFLASAESDGISGKLISAVWDPWQDFPDHLDELSETDIYTLRRIIPEDRGMEWGI